MQFGEYALIAPHWKDDRAVLQLFRSGEDWLNNFDEKTLARLERLVAEDVSKMSSAQLERMLNKMFHEANPDYEEDNE